MGRASIQVYKLLKLGWVLRRHRLTSDAGDFTETAAPTATKNPQFGAGYGEMQLQQTSGHSVSLAARSRLPSRCPAVWLFLQHFAGVIASGKIRATPHLYL